MIGKFAGYVIEAGDKLSRKMLAWNLHDFAKVNYAFKCENVPMSLQGPHVTDRVEMDNPLVFSLQAAYERLSSALEGMSLIIARGGRPDVDDMLEDERSTATWWRTF